MDSALKTLDRSIMTRDQFAHLGDGVLAYIKPVQSDDLRRLFPQAPAVEPGMQLFALLSADGSPILFADTRDAAIFNAMEHDLQMVSLH